MPLGKLLKGISDWWKTPSTAGKVCYRTKGEALRAFYAANSRSISAWGGLHNKGSSGEFDAINQKYDLTGKRAARDLSSAIWYAMPPGRPFCVDRIDLDALNDTTPGREHPFHLPHDVVESKAMARQYEELNGLKRGRRRKRR